MATVGAGVFTDGHRSGRAPSVIPSAEAHATSVFSVSRWLIYTFRAFGSFRELPHRPGALAWTRILFPQEEEWSRSVVDAPPVGTGLTKLQVGDYRQNNLNGFMGCNCHAKMGFPAFLQNFNHSWPKFPCALVAIFCPADVFCSIRAKTITAP